jgi:hypothetical protein
VSFRLAHEPRGAGSRQLLSHWYGCS